MFGYVRPFKPEIRYGDMEAYKSVYCALCKALGREYGWAARMTLSYDGTLIALIGAAFRPEPAVICRGRCTCNPLKKCVFYRGGDEVSYAAAVNVLLAAAKCRDGIADGTLGTRIRARAMRMLLRRAERRAAQREPGAAEYIRIQMAAQQALEQAQCAVPDAAAEPTATMTAAFLAHFAPDDAQRQVLHTLGYQLGRWVYLTDAFDDLDDDLADGTYNPLAEKFRLKTPVDGEVRGKVRDYVQSVLCADEAVIGGALELLEVHRLRPVLENLIYYGLPAVRKRLPRRAFKQEDLHERSI